MAGWVFDLFVASTPSDDMISVSEVKLIAGRGIEGDRYYKEMGTF